MKGLSSIRDRGKMDTRNIIDKTQGRVDNERLHVEIEWYILIRIPRGEADLYKVHKLRGEAELFMRGIPRCRARDV